MGELLRDIRYGARNLRRSPGFTLAAILALALGIGANTAIFSIINGVLLRPLPYPDSERIVIVSERTPTGSFNTVAPANFLDWRKQAAGFSAMSAFIGGRLTLTGNGEPEHIPILRVSAAFFDVFGVKPVLGRGFLPAEDAPGAAPLLVLSHGMWERRFGRDPAIVGREIPFDSGRYTVAGVLPPDFRIFRQFEALTPIALDPATAARDYHDLLVFARLRPGVTLHQARAEMESIAAGIATLYPQHKKGWSAGLETLHERTTRGPRGDMPMLAGAALFVLLIACANVASLLLGKAAARRREIAVRAALGARRARLLRQLLTESVLLALPGGALGALLAAWIVRGLQAAVPVHALPPGADLSIDARVLAFTLVLSVFTGVLFGLVPALRSTRVDLHQELKQASRTASGGANLRGALVVVELALSLVLVAGAGLMGRSLLHAQRARAGFDPGDVLTMTVELPAARYAGADRIRIFYRDALERLAAIPGVRSAAFSTALPLGGWAYGMSFEIAERPAAETNRRPTAHFQVVTPDYFRTMGMRLLQGRALAPSDTAAAPRVAVVDETLARRFLNGENPLGKHVRVQGLVPHHSRLSDWVSWEIVGVVERVGVRDIDSANPEMYVPFDQSPLPGGVLSLRTSVPPLQAAAPAKAAIQALDRNLPVTNLRTMEQIRRDSLAIPRVLVSLIGGFGVVALLLAIMGTYGLMAWSVAQRARELGIRTALGARRADLLRLVLGRALLLAAIGLAIGMGGALALGRVAGRLLYGITPHDPATLTTAAAVLVGATLAAAWFPARRAARTDPITALREE